MKIFVRKIMELKVLYALAWSKNYTTLDFFSIPNDYDFGILRKRYVLAKNKYQIIAFLKLTCKHFLLKTN